MSWNPVLNMFVEIKNEFIKECGENALWQYGHKDSFTDCLSYWVWNLGRCGHPKRHLYNKMIEPLLLNESMGMLLVKYKDLGIDWDAYDGFYRECRSVVIDVLNDCLILTPFRKFFNVGEREETRLEVIQEKIKDGANIEITDKLDGSMVSAAWYQEDLVMSGSQALDINKSYRLKNYYHWMYQNPNAMLMVKDNDDYTFIFEGIFPDDVHVVQYDESMCGLHLLGMRRIADGKELPYYQVIRIADMYGVPHTRIFDMTFDEVYQDITSNGREANEGEGYVLNIDDRKYKIKYDSYVQIHRALAKIVSPNAIIAAIREKRWDDFYSKIPRAYQPQAKEIADNVYKYIQIFNYYADTWLHMVEYITNHTTDRKTFMVAVNENVPKEYQGVVRARFLGKEIDYLRSIKYSDILDYLEFIRAVKS